MNTVLPQLKTVSAGWSFIGGGSLTDRRRLHPHSCGDVDIMLEYDFAVIELLGVTHAPVGKPNKLVASMGWIWVGLLL